MCRVNRRFAMGRKQLASSVVILAVVAASAAIARGQAAVATANGPKAAGPKLRTPWGHPDLQGVWTNHHGGPPERPSNLSDKSELTNQEVAALETAAAANRDRAIPG